MLAAVRSYREIEEDMEFDLRECELLGQGHNGIVYRLPDGRVIKIFKDKKNCKKEYMILKGAAASPHFPKAYVCGGNYIIRDYVGGICAKDYIKEKGMSRKLALNLIELIREFKKLKFTKLDIRCRDLYIQPDEYLMVIDPKSSYNRKVDFPRHLAKGLKKLGVLDFFLDVVKSEDSKLHDEWVEKMKAAGVIRVKKTTAI